MSGYRQIEEYWRNQPSTPEEPMGEARDRVADPCTFAQTFAETCQPLLTSAHEQPNEVSVNIAMLLLQAKFFDLWRDLPGEHKRLAGHRCVFQVYEDAYAQLRQLELRILPPKFAHPAPPPPPPRKPEHDFWGAGEQLDDDDEEEGGDDA